MSLPSHHHTVLTCPLCGHDHALIPLARGERAKCVRCDALMASHPRGGPHTAPALALTGLLLAIPAAALPFLTVDKFGNVRSGSFVSSLEGLRDYDMSLLALWVLICGALTPLFLLAALVISRWQPERARQFGHALAHWSMPEVYVLGVLVALTRLGSIVDVEINAGFWCYVGMSVALLLAWRAFRLENLDVRTA
ncbi:MAG: paraquat-inducible protein A [Rariglobus sp.]